jgi:ATP sulfurylase
MPATSLIPNIRIDAINNIKVDANLSAVGMTAPSGGNLNSKKYKSVVTKTTLNDSFSFALLHLLWILIFSRCSLQLHLHIKINTKQF